MKNTKRIFGLLLGGSLLTGCQNPYQHDTSFVIAFILIALIIALFFVLAFYSNILRDEVNDCDEFVANAQKIQQKQKSKLVTKSNPFSLTKVQFGVWTVIISSSYIYLSLCKGDCAEGPINKTALVLMGIFAGTAVASTLQDKKEIDENRPRHQNSPSQGFFIDMLSDDNGISLHRFQNFVWTVIAMTVYVYKVSEITTGCVLPELSDTLLTLTGISSATYLVLRSKENDDPPAVTTDSAINNPVQQIIQPDAAAQANTVPAQQLAS